MTDGLVSYQLGHMTPAPATESARSPPSSTDPVLSPEWIGARHCLLGSLEGPGGARNVAKD